MHHNAIETARANKKFHCLCGAAFDYKKNLNAHLKGNGPGCSPEVEEEEKNPVVVPLEGLDMAWEDLLMPQEGIKNAENFTQMAATHS